jgi:hypothetical protein
MKLKLTFDTPENQSKFLATVGELDASSLPIGLMNMALKNPSVTSLESVGDAIMFHVRDSAGNWVDEVIADPITRIKAGEIIEAADTQIKLLALTGPATAVTAEVTWGQNRIANRYQPLVADPALATLTEQRRVEVIVMDSGIMKSHSEFANATIEDLYFVPSMTDSSDTDGHGTAIASLIVGKQLGVNKLSVIKNVKIFSDTSAATLRELGLAMDAIYDYHMSCVQVPKIVNMSWVTVKSAYLEAKITKLIDAGMVVVAAAGNTSINIDDVTPAGLAGVFTVSGTNSDDSEYVAAYGVNKKIDLFAPAKDLAVASIGGGFITATGTSLSAAFTSGIASILAGLFNEAPSAFEIKDSLVKDSTPSALNVNAKVSVSENRLLHRLDSTSLPPNQVYYAGALPVADTTQKLQLNINSIIPINSFENATAPLVFTIVWNQPEFAAFANQTTVNESGGVSIQLSTGVTLPVEEKMKQVSFNITCNSPGITFVSPEIHFFATSESATEQDISAILDQLDSQSYLMLHGALHSNIK